MNRNHLTFALCCVLALSSGCSHEAYEKPPVPVGVAAVSTYMGEEGVRYSANVEPYTTVVLAFKVGGYVGGIMQVRGADGHLRDVQAGDLVARGAVLARLRQEDYQAKLAEARSQKAEAAALLEKATPDFGRANRLFAGQNITRPEFEAARAQYDAAQAKQQGAAALVDEAQTAMHDSSLRAPISGVLLKRLIEMGSLVGPGTPGFAIADTRSVKVVYGIPDVLLGTQRLGSPMTITTEAVPDRQFRGRITAIAPNADVKSRLFDVEITVPNPQGLLKAGMIASLEVPEAEIPASPEVVPISAIVRSRSDSARYAVFVVERQADREIARARNIELGDTYGNLIAVSSGVHQGEQVIVTGATIVTDGQRVRIIP